MKHSKYEYIKTLIESGEPVLLVSEAGCGKTTMTMQIAEELGLDFCSISMTKQTAVSALIGFISINGTYIPSQLRDAYENGKLMLLDELDAADPNVLLTLNTIENGFIAFPDKIVQAHPNFRLVATANPFNAHTAYTGRSKLDLSTIDRYFTVELERDDNLEKFLTSPELFEEVTVARKVLVDNGITTHITMRDSIRMHRLQKLGITECAFKDVVFTKHPEMYGEFLKVLRGTVLKDRAARDRTQFMCTTIEELWETIKIEAEHKENQ